MREGYSQEGRRYIIFLSFYLHGLFSLLLSKFEGTYTSWNKFLSSLLSPSFAFSIIIFIAEISVRIHSESFYEAAPFVPSAGMTFPSLQTLRISLWQPGQGVETAKPGHMPGVHHSFEGGGQGLLTIRFNSWFWIICPSGFKFFLTSSLLGPGGDGVLPFWFLSFSLSLFPLSSFLILHCPHLSLSLSIIPFLSHSISPSLSPPSCPHPSPT